MTLEAKLTAVLKAVCPHAFTDFAPNGTPRPCITFQQIGGQVIPVLGKEVPSVENAEMQINVWSDTRTEAKALIKQIESALILAATVQAKPLAAPASDFDSDIPVYCSRQDFSIWCDRDT
jgi:hypothetical protein